jgi:hypothetical protein
MRQTKLWYQKEQHAPSDPDSRMLVPATIYTNTRFPGYFHVCNSSTGIPVTVPPTSSQCNWELPDIDHAFVDTPEFHKKILGINPPFEDRTGHNIATGIELETLVTCSNGSFEPETKFGSHGWVIATTDKTILAQGSGPTDGHHHSCLPAVQN